jgi:hypothetical protein
LSNVIDQLHEMRREMKAAANPTAPTSPTDAVLQSVASQEPDTQVSVLATALLTSIARNAPDEAQADACVGSLAEKWRVAKRTHYLHAALLNSIAEAEHDAAVDEEIKAEMEASAKLTGHRLVRWC